MPRSASAEPVAEPRSLPPAAAPPEAGAGPAAAEEPLIVDAGEAVPFRERMAVRLTALILAGTLAIVAASTFAELRIERVVMAQVEAQSMQIGETIAGALHRAMLQDRRPDAYRILEDVGRQPGIERIRLVDARGRVAASTDPAEVGAVLDRTEAACSGCHEAGTPRQAVADSGRVRIFEPDGRGPGGHRVLGVVTPFDNDASCAAAACHAHPEAQRVLGVLDVELSLARADLAVAAFRWTTLGVASLVALLVGWGFWVFTRRELVRPVTALVDGARRVGRGDLDAEVPGAWRGELGLLASAFNAMTRSLKAARAQLRALLEDLERQVEDRTAALRSAQEQLVRTEKLSSLGKLSASIAHEINNPLAGILAFAKLIARTLEQGPADDESRRGMVRNLRLVERETERCSAIVRSLLDFARDRPVTLREIRLEQVFDEALQLLGNQVQVQGVQVERRFQQVPAVQGDFGMLRQVVVNVIMNACDVMPRGGTLTLSLAEVDGEVELAVQDTGPGIPKEHLSKIFDPFFTTKEKGTGLGLSVVYGVVERHGGRVTVESEPGRGTRVAIRLPALAADGATGEHRG
jgi:two-component system NtrC family sensor kinase